MSEILSLLVSGVVLILLAAPPALALRMLFRRLGDVGADRRMPYQALIAIVGIVLVFNLTVWVGMPQGLRALLPDLIAGNLGVAALLASWGCLGLGALLAVLHPRRARQRSSI